MVHTSFDIIMQKYAGFEVPAAVVTNSTIFSDIMLCSSMNVNRRFRGTFRLDLQD
jgi:hypothetical protein